MPNFRFTWRSSIHRQISPLIITIFTYFFAGGRGRGMVTSLNKHIHIPDLRAHTRSYYELAAIQRMIFDHVVYEQDLYNLFIYLLLSLRLKYQITKQN